MVGFSCLHTIFDISTRVDASWELVSDSSVLKLSLLDLCFPWSSRNCESSNSYSKALLPITRIVALLFQLKPDWYAPGIIDCVSHNEIFILKIIMYWPSLPFFHESLILIIFLSKLPFEKFRMPSPWVLPTLAELWSARPLLLSTLAQQARVGGGEDLY